VGGAQKLMELVAGLTEGCSGDTLESEASEYHQRTLQKFQALKTQKNETVAKHLQSSLL
jgi:hypothetical protein